MGLSGSSGLSKKQRKARTAFTDHQLQTLEKSFERQKYLSVQDRMELANKLGLSDTQVKTWYQNRRWVSPLGLLYETLISTKYLHSSFRHHFVNVLTLSIEYNIQLSQFHSTTNWNSSVYYELRMWCKQKQLKRPTTRQFVVPNELACGPFDSYTVKQKATIVGFKLLCQDWKGILRILNSCDAYSIEILWNVVLTSKSNRKHSEKR